MFVSFLIETPTKTFHIQSKKDWIRSLDEFSSNAQIEIPAEVILKNARANLLTEKIMCDSVTPYFHHIPSFGFCIDHLSEYNLADWAQEHNMLSLLL